MDASLVKRFVTFVTPYGLCKLVKIFGDSYFVVDMRPFGFDCAFALCNNKKVISILAGAKEIYPVFNLLGNVVAEKSGAVFVKAKMKSL